VLRLKKRLLRTDGRAGRDLEGCRVDVDSGGRWIEHPGSAQTEDREDDRTDNESADHELIRDTARRAPFLRLTLPLALLLLAPFPAQLGGHALPQYRHKLTSH